MYLIMAGLQLPLFQMIALPSRPKKEATSIDRADFNIVGPCN
jgi:hypothetical protein